MKSLSNPSLVQRATVAVVSSLWNQTDIAREGNVLCDKEHWEKTEYLVLSCIKNLQLPAELKPNLLNFVQPMEDGILSFLRLTYPTFKYHAPSKVTFIWTEKGALDHYKTAKLIIKHCSDNKMLCFHLASIFCIEDVILRYWSESGDAISGEVAARKISLSCPFLAFWICHLENRLEELMGTDYEGDRDPYVFAFVFTLEKRCIPSLKYFLQKMQPEQRQSMITYALNIIFQSFSTYLCDGNLVLFLFSFLKESKINEIKSKYPYHLLHSFLTWPCQEFFMDHITSLGSLSNGECLNLFQDFLRYASKYYASSIYKNIFKQFWHLSSFRSYAINKCISGSLISRVFYLENIDDIALMMLNDFDSDSRKLMLFNFEGMNLCDSLARKGRWESLELLVKSCIATNADLEEFIEQYKNYRPYYYNEERTYIIITRIKEWYK